MEKPWSYARIPDQSGRTIIITGGTDGLGLSLAKDFVQKTNAARVVLAARNPEKAKTAISEKLQSDPRVEFVALDLSDLNQIRRAAAAIRVGKFDEGPEASSEVHCTLKGPVTQIDALVLNAGLLNSQNKSETVDGLEATIAVCHFGHFLLASLLFDLCRVKSATVSGPAFIVSVSSVGHTWTKHGLDLDDLNWTQRKYVGFEAYFQAKLANVYFANHLAKMLAASTNTDQERKVIVVSNSPGYGKSSLYREVNWFVRLLSPLVWQDCDKLSLNTMRACTDTTLAGGEYLTPQRMNFYGPPTVGKCSKLAQDEEIAEKLWARTEEIVGHKFTIV